MKSFINNILEIPYDVNFTDTLYDFVYCKYLRNINKQNIKSIFIFPGKLAANSFTRYLLTKSFFHTDKFKIITCNDIDNNIEDLLSDENRELYNNKVSSIRNSAMSEMEELLLITEVVQQIIYTYDSADSENCEIKLYIKQNNDQNFRYTLLYNVKEYYANEISIHLLKLGNVRERVLAYIIEQIEKKLNHNQISGYFKNFKIQNLFRVNDLMRLTQFKTLQKAIFLILPCNYVMHLDHFKNLFLNALNNSHNDVYGSVIVRNISNSPYYLSSSLAQNHQNDSIFITKLLRCEVPNQSKIDSHTEAFIRSQQSENTRLSMNYKYFKDDISEIDGIVNFALKNILKDKHLKICIIGQNYEQCRSINKRLAIQLKNLKTNINYNEMVMSCAPTTLIEDSTIHLLIEIAEYSKLIKQKDLDSQQKLTNIFLSILRNPLTLFYNIYSVEIAWFEQQWITEYAYSGIQLSKILFIALENLNKHKENREDVENKEKFLKSCIEMTERLTEFYEYTRIHSNFNDILQLHLSILYFALLPEINKTHLELLMSYGKEIHLNRWLKSQFSLNDYSNILYALCYRKNQYNEFKSKPITICTPTEARYLNFDYTIICGLQDGVLPNRDLGNNYITEGTRYLSYTNNKVANQYKTFETLELNTAIEDFISLLYSSKNISLTSSTNQKGKSSQAHTFVTILSNYDKRFKFSLFNEKRLFDEYEEKKRDINLLNDISANNIYLCNAKYRKQFTQFSSTSFEGLMQNPYVFFLRYILKLEPYKKVNLIDDSFERKFGLLIHKIAHNLTQKNAFKLNYQSYKLLIQNVIKQSMISLKISADLPVMIIWKPKIEQIFEELFQLYSNEILNINGVSINSEIALNEVLYRDDKIDIKFKTIIDAVIINQSKGLIILVDYKTGGLPSFNDIILGDKPQLALESAVYHKYTKNTLEIATQYLHLKYQQGTSGIPHINIAFENEIIINEIKKICQMFYSDQFSFCGSDEVYEKEYMHFMRKA